MKKLINSVTCNEFNEKNARLMKQLIEIVYGKNIDTVTYKRISDAIRKKKIDMSWLDEIETNFKTWGSEIFSSNYAEIVNKSSFSTFFDIAETMNIDRFKINIQDIKFENFIKNETGKLVVDMTVEQMKCLNLTLAQSLKSGMSIDRTKEVMRMGMTLTGRENLAVMNSYDRYYTKELARLTNSKKFSVAKAKELAQKRAKYLETRKYNYLKQGRLTRISVTEVTRGYNFGRETSISKSITDGKIKAATKTWRKTGSHDNWESSDLYNGKSVSVGESFSVFGIPGKTTMIDFNFPSEIHERCIVEYTVN